MKELSLLYNVSCKSEDENRPERFWPAIIGATRQSYQGDPGIGVGGEGLQGPAPIPRPAACAMLAVPIRTSRCGTRAGNFADYFCARTFERAPDIKEP